MKYTLLLLGLLFFTGCHKPPVELQHMTHNTQVGVVSAGLNELRIQTAHSRAKYAQIDISDMQLDRIFEEKLIKKLSHTKMHIRRVSVYADRNATQTKTMEAYKSTLKSFWRGLYYYAKQKRWNTHHKERVHPLYALEDTKNKKAIFQKNHLDYLIFVIEPYVYNEGLQSQIRIGYPLIGDPYILFEPMVSMQRVKNGKITFVTRLDKIGYRQIETYNTKPWENNGELKLSPEIRKEIKAIILKQMDKVVEDVYSNMVEFQSSKNMKK